MSKIMGNQTLEPGSEMWVLTFQYHFENAPDAEGEVMDNKGKWSTRHQSLQLVFQLVVFSVIYVDRDKTQIWF